MFAYEWVLPIYDWQNSTLSKTLPEGDGVKFVFYTNSISPHQLPLARELVKRLGEDNYRYIYTTPLTVERKNLGWNVDDAKWIICEKDDLQNCRELLENCDILMSGLRDFALFEKRLAKGLKTIYSSERWFKPVKLFDLRLFDLTIYLPGWIRLLHPRYFNYARKIAQLLSSKHPFNLSPIQPSTSDQHQTSNSKLQTFNYYPMGIWAQRDMELICRIFRVPKSVYQSHMHLWGYFVAPSDISRSNQTISNLKSNNSPDLPISTAKKSLRVLWVGRFLVWKRVDTLIRAVVHANSKLQTSNIKLDIYGLGPKEHELKKLASTLQLQLSTSTIIFHTPVPIAEVRQLMHTHDLYVMPSNAEEGWGAVVSEALEEGMRVIGTYEAGSSATILPESNLYHAGDWKNLSKMLTQEIPVVPIGRWNVQSAANHLMEVIG